MIEPSMAFPKRCFVTLVLCLFFISIDAFGRDKRVDYSQFPIKGMVTMIDLGAKKCVPCKMMAPILEKMEKKYEGRAVVLFIDVWKHREQAVRFRIQAIPTQIFFDAKGKEIYRHVGFMAEKDIIATMSKLGVKP